MKVLVPIFALLAVAMAGCISDGDDPDGDFEASCPEWRLAPGQRPAIWNWIHDPTSDPETSDFANKDESTMYIYRPSNAKGHDIDGDITDFYQLELTVGLYHGNGGMNGSLLDTRLEIVVYEATDEPNRVNKSEPLPDPKGERLLFQPLGQGAAPMATLVFHPGENITDAVYHIKTREPGEPLNPIDLRMDVHFFGDIDGDPSEPSLGSVEFVLTRWHLNADCPL